MLIETAPNIHVYVEDYAPENPKATLVLIHGWPVNGRMFEYQAAQLPALGIRTITIDLRGFGLSDKPWSGLDYDNWAADIDAVMAKLDLRDVVLGGFSMGGAVVMNYAARPAANRLRKLVLMGAAGPCLQKKDDNPDGAPREAYDGLIQACYTDRAKMNADFGKLLFEKTVSPELDRFFQDLGMQASNRATARGLEELRDRDTRSILSQIKIPVMICHGVHDKVIPFNLGAMKQCQLIPHADVIRFEESGHGLFIDEGAKLTKALADFALS